MKNLYYLLPEWAQKKIWLARDFLRAIIYRRTGRLCPVCGPTKFQEFGIVPRKDAQCVRCGALERHRFVWLYFNKMTDLFDGRPKRVLHVAPEPTFEQRLKNRLGNAYITADLFDPRAMVQMDITDIQFPDDSFDVIYCSHVLEHVQDDKRALREFHRVLKRTGWALLMVPITADKTFEDPAIVDPSARLKIFGQGDHVRRYGPDFEDRLREAGFQVTISRISDLTADTFRMGLTLACGEIFYCTKV